MKVIPPAFGFRMYVMLAEKSGVLWAGELNGFVSAAVAWFAPFHGPVCAGKGRKLFGSSSKRISVPLSKAARIDNFLMSPPISIPASSKPQGWKTYGTPLPPAAIGTVWKNGRALLNGRSEAPKPSHGWNTPTRAVKNRSDFPYTNRTYAFSISNTSSGEVDNSANEPKYFPHDPVNGYKVNSWKLTPLVVVRVPGTPPITLATAAPFGWFVAW